MNDKKPPEIDYAKLVHETEEAPFHKWLGVRVLRADPESVEIMVPWRDDFFAQVQRTYLHGGVLAALVDLTADFAIAARIGRALPTIDLRIDYHRPVSGGEVRATGMVIKAGRTIATAEARVYDAKGSLVASGRGAYLSTRN